MFKVGQLVWCTNNEQYIQTDYHVKCIVIGIRQNYIRVRIAEGRYMNGTLRHVSLNLYRTARNLFE